MVGWVVAAVATAYALAPGDACNVVTAPPYDWDRAACERTVELTEIEVDPQSRWVGLFFATTPGKIVVSSTDYLDHELRHAWDAQHGYEPAAVRADLALLAAQGGEAGEAADAVLRYQPDDLHLNHNLVNRVQWRTIPAWYRQKRLGYLQAAPPVMTRRTYLPLGPR